MYDRFVDFCWTQPEDEPVVAAELPLVDSGVLGSFRRVDPDDAAAALYL